MMGFTPQELAELLLIVGQLKDRAVELTTLSTEAFTLHPIVTVTRRGLEGQIGFFGEYDGEWEFVPYEREPDNSADDGVGD